MVPKELNFPKENNNKETSTTFFKKIPEQIWESKYKKISEEYNKKESMNINEVEGDLTGNNLTNSINSITN